MTRKQTKSYANLNKQSTLKLHTCMCVCVCVCVCASLCTTVVHKTAQDSSDNCPSYPPDNHHCSDDVYRREGGTRQLINVYTETSLR